MNELGVRDYEPDSAHVPERLTLRLSPEARKTLEWLAEERHVSLAEVIRRALGTEKFFIEMQKKNGKILIDVPGERIKEVVHL
jgi:hypothetical protein